MHDLAYLNGEFLPLADVRISPLDRGFLFGDGVYEVVPAWSGTLFHATEHVDRLRNSLAFVRIDAGDTDWTRLFEELVARSGGTDTGIYLQVSRGAPATRAHVFPDDVPPTVFAMTYELRGPSREALEGGVAVTVLPDLRWGACHVKAISLLPNVLASQSAREAGCADAVLVRDGQLTETTSGNLFVVRGGTILTPVADSRILPGVTRRVLLDLARGAGIPVEETGLPAACLTDADEVWLSSTTRDVLPVTRLDGRPVGDGRPGPLWRRVWDLFQAHKRTICARG